MRWPDESAGAGQVTLTGRNRRAGAYQLTRWSISYSGKGSLRRVRASGWKSCSKGGGTPGGGDLERRDQAALRDGYQLCGGGPCDTEGASGASPP